MLNKLINNSKKFIINGSCLDKKLKLFNFHREKNESPVHFPRPLLPLYHCLLPHLNHFRATFDPHTKTISYVEMVAASPHLIYHMT